MKEKQRLEHERKEAGLDVDDESLTQPSLRNHGTGLDWIETVGKGKGKAKPKNFEIGGIEYCGVCEAKVIIVRISQHCI